MYSIASTVVVVVAVAVVQASPAAKSVLGHCVPKENKMKITKQQLQKIISEEKQKIQEAMQNPVTNLEQELYRDETVNRIADGEYEMYTDPTNGLAELNYIIERLKRIYDLGGGVSMIRIEDLHSGV